MAAGRRPIQKSAGSTGDTAWPPWSVTAGIVGTSVALQGAIWALLYEVFGVLSIGYPFFEASDIVYYYEAYATRIAQGLLPFRDFFIEYPPLFVLLLLAPGTHVGEVTYVVRFSVLMMAFMAAACAMTALAEYGGESPARSYVVAVVFSAYTLLLGPIAANRYDAAVALLLAGVLLAMAHERWTVAAALLGIGFALKITPAMLLPLILMVAPRARIGRVLAGFAVAAVTPFLGVLLLGGKTTLLWQMVMFHLSRPLEIESVLATPIWIGRLAGLWSVHVGLAFGSQVIVSRLGDLIARLSSGVLLLALGAVFFLVWRRKKAVASDKSLMFLAVLATILASFVGSKVLSPQYLVWVLPAVALVAPDRRPLGLLMAVALLLTHIEFPANYLGFAADQAPAAVAIVVVRNLVLLTAFGLALWELWRIPDVGKPPTKSA